MDNAMSWRPSSELLYSSLQPADAIHATRNKIMEMVALPLQRGRGSTASQKCTPLDDGDADCTGDGDALSDALGDAEALGLGEPANGVNRQC